MTQFTKSFLWRFILDIILLGIFVRLMQNIILAILSRSMETYDDVDYVYDKMGNLTLVRRYGLLNKPDIALLMSQTGGGESY